MNVNTSYVIVWFLVNFIEIALYLVLRRRVPEIRRRWLSCLILILKCMTAAAAGAALMILGKYRTPFIAAAQILLTGDCISDLALAMLSVTCRKYKSCFRNIRKTGYLAAAITTILIFYGFINTQFIVQTHYNVFSDRLKHSYRIVYLSDIHYGTIQDITLINKTVNRINALDPDVVIFGGDITDEYTSNAEMIRLYSVLGSIKSTYGSYFVYGNHDDQLPGSLLERTYSDNELTEAAESNGITVLRDDVKEINNDLLLAGRDNAFLAGRKDLSACRAMADDFDERYSILLDHQPVELKKASESGFDLMLSGHLHAGQLFPEGIVGRLEYPVTRGETQIGDMALIISSGFSGWGYPCRTESHCEYEVIDLNNI
jgi:predicted MPP superfamily phosphohydrolase